MASRPFDPAWLDAHRVRLAPVDRASIVGIGHVMVEVDALLARLRDPDRAAALGVSPPRGILLWGDPGLGKTLVARYIATSLDASIPFFEVSSDELSPSRLKGVLHHLAATYERSVLYLDEIDHFATDRTSLLHSSGSRLLLAAALAGLDGLVSEAGPIVIAASNRGPEELDAALMRAGRFSVKVEFDRPNVEEREALLRLFLRSRSDGDIDLRAAAQVAHGLTPADLRALVDDAAGLALAADRDAIASIDVFAALRRVGHVRPEDVARDYATRRRIAIHEAGHVVAVIALRGAESLHSVRLLGTHGTTLTEREHEPGRAIADDELLDRLVIAYAGLAGELKVLGTGSLGSAEDIGGANQTALSRVMFGLDPSVPALLPALFGDVPPAVLLDLHGRAVSVMLEVARDVATLIVDRNAVPIERIADELLRVDDLSGDQLRALLAEVVVEIPEGIHLRALVERQADGRRKGR